ncbi:uncharacterized protein LOC122073240 isoform X2 [Macadamia integrifolia]|uniref:uncharacterized protein LOC122073240 isoform X2 n=1 Tax=Macadamia integrifolia TaxID=60698 RepID=UPI001C4F1DB6|nr:uncharacterized protein LOC122073240 isoform X2 [Macadamia integrifolia]
MGETERESVHLRKHPKPIRKKRSKFPGKKNTGGQKAQVVVGFPNALDPFPSSSTSEPRQGPEPQEQKKIASLPHLISSNNCYCDGKGSHKLPSADNCKTKARQTTTSMLGTLDFGTSTPQNGEKRRRRGKPLSCLTLTETENPSFYESTNEVEAHPPPPKDGEGAMAAALVKRRRTRSDGRPPTTNGRKKNKKKLSNNKSQQLQVVSPFFHNNKAISSAEKLTQNSPPLPNTLIKEKISRILLNSPFSRSSSLSGEDGKTNIEKAANDLSKNKEDCNGVPNGAEKALLFSSDSHSYGTVKIEDKPDAEDAGIDASPSNKRQSIERQPPKEAPENVRVVSSYFQTPTLTVQQQQQRRKVDYTTLKPHSKAKTRRPNKKKVVVVSPYFCNVATKEEEEEGGSYDEFTSTSWNNDCKRQSTNNAPVLSASQKLDEAYRRVTPDNPWKPPRSHFPLLQEDHVHDPWRVLVICMLLNRTSGAQA